MRGVLLVIVVASAGALCAQPTAECDRGGVLSAAGIGPLRVGMPADSLERVCTVLSKAFVPEYSITSYAIRAGADTAFVWVRSGRVETIRTRSPLHLTRDSLGVGAAAQRILHLPDVKGGAGETANMYVIYPTSGPHCGLSFWLDGATATMLSTARGDPLRLLAMRGAGTVVEVEIRGECKPEKQP